jgi:hypothetical protein
MCFTDVPLGTKVVTKISDIVRQSRLQTHNVSEVPPEDGSKDGLGTLIVFRLRRRAISTVSASTVKSYRRQNPFKLHEFMQFTPVIALRYLFNFWHVSAYICLCNNQKADGRVSTIK